MFTITFKTQKYRPGMTVSMHTNVDGWDKDVPGSYDNDEWRFELSTSRYQGGFAFKFVLDRTYWMLGDDLFLHPLEGGRYQYIEQNVNFPQTTEILVENGRVQQLFFQPNLSETQLHDVIVIGSGIGGGLLADELSDSGLDVLVLEAGSYLFPTHVANLPRQHRVGEFSKHVWGLFDEFAVVNYVNADRKSKYEGGQAFNLGGRSVFWGGLIPRMAPWELDLWPAEIKSYLETSGYARGEELMNMVSQPPAAYPQSVKQFLNNELPDFDHLDAPLAVQYSNTSLGTIPTGMFSTADLLMESRLTDDKSGNAFLTINLNHAVTRLETQGGRVTGVVAYDLIARKERHYKAKHVVLCAGTVESAKIAKLSQLQDPNDKIGVGITDHPIYFTHFAVPSTSAFFAADSASKTISRHKLASVSDHPYNMVLELGADFNQGRFVDADILKRHQDVKGNSMLCEIVFLFNAPLIEQNWLDQPGPSSVRPVVRMEPSAAADPFLNEINDVKQTVLQGLDAQAIVSGNLNLEPAGLGRVAHEVGTLRIGANNGVVDTDLKFLAYDNLYACDLSVFPTSPAANPTLTLAALASRLAAHLKQLP